MFQPAHECTSVPIPTEIIFTSAPNDHQLGCVGRRNRCGVYIDHRIHRLQLNYRTTEQIRSWATAKTPLLESNDLSGENISDFPAHSLLEGPDPELLHSKDQSSEARMLSTLLGKFLNDYSPEDI
jgi:hypothetical protein